MITTKGYSENQIAIIVVEPALKIHKQLGSGMLETAYQKILKVELEKRGLTVEAEVPISVTFEGVVVDSGFWAEIY